MKAQTLTAALALLLLQFSALCSAAVDSTSVNMTSLDQYGLPDCGNACLIEVLPRYDCAVEDLNCICPNYNVSSALETCLLNNCTRPNELTVDRLTKTTCGMIPRDERNQTRALTWALFGLASLFVAARFVARPQRLRGSGYGTDDFTIGAVYVVLIPLNVLVQTMTDSGLGVDDYSLSSAEITDMLHQFYAFEILYVLLVMGAKISVLQLYLRIWTTDAVSRWFRRAVYVLIGLHLVTMVAYVFSLIFQCTPVSYAWTWWDGIHDGWCIQRLGHIYSLGAINICYDVIVFFLPLHNFLKLNISWRRKIGVCVAFMFGCFVTVCSIVRLQYLVRIGVPANVPWEYNAIVQWSIVECNLSIVCTCIPAMAGLVQRLWAMLSGKTGSMQSHESTAPIKPETIDPENPVSNDEMLHMRRPDSISAGSMTEYNTSDSGAPTKICDKSQSGDEKYDGVAMEHSPPSIQTATNLTYRDHAGRLHEVKVIDRPTDDVDHGQAHHPAAAPMYHAMDGHETSQTSINNARVMHDLPEEELEPGFEPPESSSESFNDSPERRTMGKPPRKPLQSWPADPPRFHRNDNRYSGMPQEEAHQSRESF